MMVDPDGELAWFIPVIIGAVLNVGVNAAQGNIDNFWDGLGYAAIGGASGLVGFGAGQAVAGAVGTVGFAGGALTGAVGGFAGGFVGGSGNAWAGGANFGDGLSAGLTSGGYGALTGGVIGGVSGGIQSVKHGGNFWSGKGASFDVSALQGNYKGDPVEYSNKSAKGFSDDWFGKDIGGLDNLYTDGSMPNGYTTKGGAVFNGKGNEVLGTTSYNGTGKGSDVFLYKNAFQASQKLYMVMGHEYIHVAHFNARLFNTKFSEHSALTWTRDQAKAFGTLPYNKTWAKEVLKIKYYNKAYDYNKFMINPIFNFWSN